MKLCANRWWEMYLQTQTLVSILQATGSIFVSPVPHGPSSATLSPQPPVPQPCRTKVSALMSRMVNCPRTSPLPHCVKSGVLLCLQKLKPSLPLLQSTLPLRQTSPPHLSTPPSLESPTPAPHGLAGSVWLTLVQACSAGLLLPLGNWCATDTVKGTNYRARSVGLDQLLPINDSVFLSPC